MQLGDRALGCDGALVSSIQAKPQAIPKAQPTHSGSLILFDASLTLARVRNVASPLVFCRFFPIL